MAIAKTVPELKQGDIVHVHGGRFQLPDNAKACALIAVILEEVGPHECVRAEARCIEGRGDGYFWPGSKWAFQSNRNTTHAVDI